MAGAGAGRTDRRLHCRGTRHWCGVRRDRPRTEHQRPRPRVPAAEGQHGLERISDDFLEEVSAYLLPGKAAVITELEEEWQAPIDTRMEALGGHVFRRNWIAVEDAYYEKANRRGPRGVGRAGGGIEETSAERKARLEARIQDTRHKLQDKQNQLKARIESVRREGEAKIGSLQQQLTTARDG